jgi:hypothetical protein
MSYSRPIQWYHSHVDPIWPDGTFKVQKNISLTFFQRNRLKKVTERVNGHLQALDRLRGRWQKLQQSQKEDDIDFQPLLAFVHYYVECFS